VLIFVINQRSYFGTGYLTGSSDLLRSPLRPQFSPPLKQVLLEEFWASHHRRLGQSSYKLLFEKNRLAPDTLSSSTYTKMGNLPPLPLGSPSARQPAESELLPTQVRRLARLRHPPLLLAVDQIVQRLEAVLQVSPNVQPYDCLSLDGYLFKIERLGTNRIQILSGTAGVDQPLSKALLASLGAHPVWDNDMQDLIKGKTQGLYSRHLNIGDYFSDRNKGWATSHFLIDIEPEVGGGLITPDTTFHLSGEPLSYIRRVRFARAAGEPAITDEACRLLKSMLKRRAGHLYLCKNLIIRGDVDFNGEQRQWLVHSLDDDQAVRGVLAHNTLIAIADLPIREPCRCSFCDLTLEPPSLDFAGLVFNCPVCNRLVINTSAGLWGEIRSSPPGPGRELLLRVQSALSVMSGRDERVQLMIQILTRLPRDLYGRLDVIVLNEIARRVDQMTAESLNIRGVRTEFLDRLPVCKYRPGMSDTRCDICLSDFVEGVDLRILPCTFFFVCVCFA